MPTLEGSCHCGGVSFTLESDGRYPYMKCYCSICRKTAGSTGAAINLGGDAATLKISGEEHLSTYRVTVNGGPNSAARRFCKHCGTHLWAFDPQWPELAHPFAGVIDSELPKTPRTVHILLDSAPAWVDVPDADADNLHFPEYPDASIEGWHRQLDLWGR